MSDIMDLLSHAELIIDWFITWKRWKIKVYKDKLEQIKCIELIEFYCFLFHCLFLSCNSSNCIT